MHTEVVLKGLAYIVMAILLIVGLVACGAPIETPSGESSLADTTPPLITNVSARDFTETATTITWSTDEPATSQVEYGMTISYGSTTPLDESLVTSHSVSLSGLEPNTTYHFKVRSKDSSGNEAISGNYTSTTITPATPMPVGGVLSGDVTWTLAKSPYTLTGHILVSQGSKLTVEPGVQVNLGDRFIQVEGTLQVLGTSQQPVKITGHTNTDHGKIIFKANSIDWDEDTQSGSIIRNATIEGQTYGSTLIEIEDSSPKIADSTIINNNPSGGAISNRGGSPRIISNRISAYYGLAVTTGSPQIIGNRIEGRNSFSGISVSLRDVGESGGAKSHVRIEGNLITGFEYGILVQAFNDNDQIDITSNHITNNQVGILTGIYEGDNPSPPLSIRMNAIHNNRENAQAGNAQGKAYDVDMSNNWWGTTDIAAIEATLYHYPQDFRLSRIIYTPFLSELPPDVPLL